MRKTTIALTTIALTLNCFFIKESAFSQKDSSTYDDGLVINGVKWATRNVDEFRTFATTPESFGKLYQWNRKKAWNATDKEVENWDDSIPEGAEWEKANDPCPCGWRLPTLQEFELLFDSESTWTEVNNIKGRKFGSGDSTIFLPAVGCFSSIERFKGTLNDTGVFGYYWSRSEFSSTRAHILMFFFGNIDTGGVGSFKKHGYSVRCVSE